MPQRQDDKFVWNDEYQEVILVRAVQMIDGFNVRLQFSNDEVREIDLEPYLHGPVFDPIRQNLDLYRAMRIEGGTLAWGDQADIAPETLYEDSRSIELKPGAHAAKRRGRAARRRPARA